ncbi:cytochrome C [Halarcobacter ebronensis]|uniref:Cytochrome C n=1 Tax=Halarcobacter ebronensis TaxID=1462615 RepID=A0A4Q0YG38_9BACT|nr:NapC/NirT family cytochrome c [Halarcobacter ebronensis]RXJ69542.1 cytochrome C [Halarcobacter ebronensis]
MKKLIFIGIGGVIIGLLLSLVTHTGLHMTSNDKFCVVCHEMRPMVAAYENDVHGGKGKVGIKVSCVSCHLPEDNLLEYIAIKARNGLIEGTEHFFGDVDSINWQENRKKRKEFVYDKGCINCHTTYKTNSAISKKGLQMHEHYDSLKNTDKKISCASCHVEVGHTGLRSMINYYNPEYDFYKNKLDKIKESVDKKLTEELNK